jgi:hypothetical protein
MKKKFELEFPVSTSVKVIFPRLSNPGGLSEWFADNVTIKGKIYTFSWDGVEQKAEQTYFRENVAVKYEWLDESEKTYFEFRLKSDELTGELALIVTDFAESDEIEESSELWESQISRLKQTIGI